MKAQAYGNAYLTDIYIQHCLSVALFSFPNALIPQAPGWCSWGGAGGRRVPLAGPGGLCGDDAARVLPLSTPFPSSKGACGGSFLGWELKCRDLPTLGACS